MKLRPLASSAFYETSFAGSAANLRAKFAALAPLLRRDDTKVAVCALDKLDRLRAMHAFPEAYRKQFRSTKIFESAVAVVRNRIEAYKRLRAGASATYGRKDWRFHHY